MKIYQSIETDTPILPYVVAEKVCEEVESLSGIRLADPVGACDTLVARAATVYKNNPVWGKLIRSEGNKGRDSLYTFMRHWLSGYVKDTQPAIFAKIERTGFLVGHYEPEKRNV